MRSERLEKIMLASDFSDLRGAPVKRHSHDMSGTGDGNRGLAKKLFGELNSDVTFTPPTKTSLPTRKSNSSNPSRSSVFDFSLEFSDTGWLSSD